MVRLRNVHHTRVLVEVAASGYPQAQPTIVPFHPMEEKVVTIGCGTVTVTIRCGNDEVSVLWRGVVPCTSEQPVLIGTPSPTGDGAFCVLHNGVCIPSLALAPRGAFSQDGARSRLVAGRVAMCVLLGALLLGGAVVWFGRNGETGRRAPRRRR